jgi:ABC-type uncharacterized transport system involved in gliding motility auxiliary subunit
MEEPSEHSFSLWRRWNIGFHVLLSIVAFLAIVGMLNYLAHRHNSRFYLSRSASQKLSPLTLSVLKSLTNTVRVTVFFNRTEPLFNSVASLIKEYGARSKKLEIEFIDYRMPGRAETIRNQYKLSPGGDSSRIIFDLNGETRTVLGSELSDYDISQGKEIRRSGFKGEQLFTSALLNLTQIKAAAAYFLQGHGEHNVNASASEEERGYSRFRQLLENNNVQVKTVAPLVNREIPADCALLVIAGPQTVIDQEELGKIERYLNRGGRLFLLFNYAAMTLETGLERLLWKYNVQVGFNRVQDSVQGQGSDNGVLVVTQFGPHPIMRPLMRSSLKMIVPRSIAQRPGAATTADAPKIVELATTSSDGMALVLQRGNVWTAQQKGQIPLMVAFEKGSISGVGAEKGTGRAVIAGDSLFVSNLGFNQAANADFANLAVNWLLNRDMLLKDIGPSPVTEYQIILTDQQLQRLRWLFLGVAPGVVVILGMLVWVRRRA